MGFSPCGLEQHGLKPILPVLVVVPGRTTHEKRPPDSAKQTQSGPLGAMGEKFKQTQFEPDSICRAEIGPVIISHRASKACCIGGPANGMLLSMAKYPVFLELGGRRVVLIGGGSVAVRKAQALLETGARLVVVAERASDVLMDLCVRRNVELVRSRYAKQYIGEAVLVVAATNDDSVNQQVYKDCQSLGILCNVVDDPELCDFFVPAVVKRGDLQIAIGTEGNCPAYAGHLRKKLEHIFTEDHGRFLAELEQIRKQIIEELPDPADRKTLLGELVEEQSFARFCADGPEAWRRKAAEAIASYTAKT